MRTVEVLERLTKYDCKHLVVTGGEPLLHQDFLSRLLLRLKALGFFIEIETNGTFVPSAEILQATDCFNVSPKITNSLVQRTSSIRAAALDAFVKSGKAWFKFVICEQEDVSEVEGLVSACNLPRERVILMPEGIDSRRE